MCCLHELLRRVPLGSSALASMPAPSRIRKYPFHFSRSLVRGRARPRRLRGRQEGGPIPFAALTRPLNLLKRTAPKKPDNLAITRDMRTIPASLRLAARQDVSSDIRLQWFFGWFSLGAFGVSLQVRGRIQELCVGQEGVAGIAPGRAGIPAQKSSKSAESRFEWMSHAAGVISTWSDNN